MGYLIIVRVPLRNAWEGRDFIVFPCSVSEIGGCCVPETPELSE